MGEKTFRVSVTSSSQGINVKPESGGQSINTTVSVTSQKNININAATKQNPIGATSDTGLYYSQLSKNWAIGDGLIQNEDYSSKTWAAESKSSADLSKMYSEAASLDYNNLSETINQYNEQISGVVAEGVDSINTTVTEALEDLETASGEIMETVEANSRALPMFSPIWSDHILNDVSYLRADTFSWHSGYIYKTAYEVLLDEYNNENCVEETENGVTYKRSPNGFKIASVEQNDVILDVYNNTGIAWYYIIDVVNMQFKLPRTQWGFVGNRDGVGGQIEAGLPSVVHTHTFSATTSSAGAHTHNITLGYAAGANWGRRGAKWGGDDVTDSNTATGTTASAGAHTHTVSGTTGGANITSNIYGKSDTVQPPATQMYLYFYIGNYQRPATEIQTGKVFDVLANKADIDGGNYVGSGLEKRIDNTLDEFLADTKDSFLNKSQITNCITEVPQRIKYTLENGTLTIKAGSVVIVPYGTEDKTSELPVGATFINDNFKVYDTQFADGKFFVWAKTLIDLSETRAVTSVYKLFFYVNFEANTLGSASISPAVSGEGVGKSQLKYRTDDNTVNYYNASSEAQQPNLSLPMGISESTGTYVYDKINQVFNGIGYIGSTIWVDKGVKGLVPNEKNDKDGSLINTEWEYTSLYLRDLSSSGNNVYKFGLNGSSSSGISAYSYDEAKNINLNGTSRWNYTYAFDLTKSDGVITSLKAKQPFRAVDYSDFANTPHIAQTYVSGTSWYRVWSDGWIEQGGQVNVAANTLATVNLLKTMSTTNYFLTGTNLGYWANDKWSITPYMKRVSTSQIQIGNVGDGQYAFGWMVCGY